MIAQSLIVSLLLGAEVDRRWMPAADDTGQAVRESSHEGSPVRRSTYISKPPITSLNAEPPIAVQQRPRPVSRPVVHPAARLVLPEQAEEAPAAKPAATQARAEGSVRPPLSYFVTPPSQRRSQSTAAPTTQRPVTRMETVGQPRRLSVPTTPSIPTVSKPLVWTAAQQPAAKATKSDSHTKSKKSADTKADKTAPKSTPSKTAPLPGAPATKPDTKSTTSKSAEGKSAANQAAEPKPAEPKPPAKPAEKAEKPAPAKETPAKAESKPALKEPAPAKTEKPAPKPAPTDEIPAAASPEIVELDEADSSRSYLLHEPWELASWYGSTRSVFLWRTDASNRGLLTDTATGATVADVENLYLPLKYGQEVMIGHLFDSASGVEASYFWIGDATGIHSAASAGTLAVPFVGPNAADFTGLTAYTSDLRSKMWNMEVNLVHFFRDGTDHPLRLSALVGPRIIDIEESFGFATTGPVSGNYTNQIENTLYGGQLGLRATWKDIWARLNIDVVGKLGLFGNDTFARQGLLSSASGLLQTRQQGSSNFAQALETGIEAVYKLRPGLHLAAGYRLLYINEIGRATDQLDFDLNHTVPAVISNGDILYHGLMVGVRLYWGDRADPSCRTGRCTPYVVRTSCP